MTDKKDKTESLDQTKTTLPNEPMEKIRIVGNYKILEEIGKGGMGTVYLAQQEKPMKRKVAIKVIKPGMDSKEVIARFESEQQALALMNHPKIAQVYDSGLTDQGHPYFVMEYVPGLPITEYCDKYKMTTKERLILFQKVCRAIQHAHFKGIVHRDIKPTNILVSFQDNEHIPKIIDFGVAKALTDQGLTEKTLHTRHGLAVGTPVYMSPEQAELTGFDIDTRTDVYSLGVLLYELLVGATPFDKDELQRAGIIEMLRIIREADPPRPTTRYGSLTNTTLDIAKNRGTSEANLRKQLQGDLEWIVMKALEKDRRYRYNSATDLATDIDNFLNKKPIQARPPSIAYKIKKYVRRHKTAAFALVSFLLLIITFSFWNTVERHRAEKSLKEANYNFAVALKEKARAYAEKKEWQLVKLYNVNSLFYQAKAQKYLLMTDIEFPFRFPDLMLKHRIYGDWPWISMASSFSLSPDAKYMASGSKSGKIKIWEVSSGKVTSAINTENKMIGFLCYSPDGKYLASGTGCDLIGTYEVNPPIIKVWEVSSGKEIVTFRGFKDKFCGTLRFSPRGRYLAYNSSISQVSSFNIESPDNIPNESTGDFLSYSGRDAVKLWEISSGKETILKGHEGFIKSICFNPDGMNIATTDSKGTIRIWDVSNGMEMTRYLDKGGGPLCYSPDGEYLAAVRQIEERLSPDPAEDPVINLLEESSGKVALELKGHKQEIKSLSYSVDGNYLASGDSANTIKIWDVSSGKEIFTVSGIGDHALFLKDGKHLATMNSKDCQLTVWEISDTETLFTLREHRGEITSLYFSKNDNALTSKCHGREVIFWDLSKQKQIGFHSNPEDNVFSLDGKYEARFNTEGTIRIMEHMDAESYMEAETSMMDPKKKMEFIQIELGRARSDFAKLKHKDVISVCFSPEGKYLASGDKNGIIKTWKLTSSQELATINTNTVPVDLIKFSDSGKYLAAFSRSGDSIEIWEASTGREIKTLRAHRGGVRTVNFSPDQTYLASSGVEDNIIKVWEISTGREIATLKGHKAEVNALDFSPDGEALASGSSDTTTKIWEIQGGKCITLRGHNGPVMSVSFSSDAKYLASGSADKTIKIWSLNHIANYLWLGLDQPHEEKDVKKTLEEVEDQIGSLLDGINPVDANFYFNSGKDCAERGEYIKAIEEYKKSLQLVPNFIKALNSLGEAYYMLGEYDEAHDAFSRSIDIDSFSPFPHFNIALTYLSQNQYKRANDYYRYIVEELSFNPYDGIGDIQELLDRKPDLIFAYLIRGYLNMRFLKTDPPDKELRITKTKEFINKFIKEYEGDQKWKDVARELLSELKSQSKK